MTETQIIELAKKIEAQVASLSAKKADDEKAQAELNAKIAELGEKQAELARKLLTAQQEAQKKGSDEKAQTLGAQFVGSTQYADLMAGKVSKASLAAVTTPTGSVPADFKGVHGAQFLPATVASAFAHVGTTSNMVTFLKETSFTNNAAEAAENTQKAESQIAFEEVEAGVKTIAHFIKVTKQLAEDAPALKAYIDARMVYGLERRIEAQLIDGNGSGANLKGIFQAGNYTVHGFTTANIGDKSATVLDLIRRCAATMRKNGYQPNALFLNPMDFDTLRGMKDKNGQYLMGSPLQSGADIRPWGLQVIESSAVTEGKFMVADTRMGATVYDRTAPVIEMFEQDGTNVQTNLYTIRAEQRLAFAVESANCFIGGDLKIGEAA